MITDLPTLKQFFRDNIKTPIFGVDVYAFDRLGLEDIAQNYRILALRYSRDTKLIEKNIEVFSLEKGLGTKHLKAPRNSTTVLTHPRTKEYLSKFAAPALIAYKSSSKMERVCRENGWTLVAPLVKFGKALFEDKIKFRKILEEIGVTPPPGEILPVKDLDFPALKKKYGVPFVLQHPRRGGGKGTFFISSQDGWHKAMRKLRVQDIEGKEVAEDISNLEVIVAKYINGPSPSITGCVTRHGILSTNPQYQLIDIPELYNPAKGSGLFCGHDWTSSRFPREIERQAYDAVEKVGRYFKAFGYKGIFGVDFVLDEEKQKLYVTESNPRLLGSFPTLTMVQIRNNEPPIIAFHVLEYLNANYEIDINQINDLLRKPKKGAQMFPHNLTGHWVRSNAKVRAGVYKLLNGKLKFIRSGYEMRHLKYEDEFLLTDGVLEKKAHYSPNRRLGRIITLGPLLLKNKKALTPWAGQIALRIHDKFRLKRVWLVGIRKFFDPDFLVKG
ncbi:MAG: ATP-grasp domain-containing protein [Candidatus Spechtbacterales bacterium]